MELEVGFQGKNKHDCYQIQVVWQLVCLHMLVQCMSSLVCYGWSECSSVVKQSVCSENGFPYMFSLMKPSCSQIDQ